jgi:hypothetical protein
VGCFWRKRRITSTFGDTQVIVIVHGVLCNSSTYIQDKPMMFDCLLIQDKEHQRLNEPPCPGVINSLRKSFPDGFTSVGFALNGLVPFIRIISPPLRKPEGVHYFGGRIAGAVSILFGGIPISSTLLEEPLSEPTPIEVARNLGRWSGAVAA